MTLPLVPLALALAAGTYFAPQEPEREDPPFTGEADWESRGREPTWGDDAPGTKVVPSKMLPIQGAPYARPQDLEHPVADGDLVIGLAVGGVARAYPVKMLGGPQREIINDSIAGEPYAVNW